jgi:putative inorganic carbon (HCO3(-)) transporter
MTTALDKAPRSSFGRALAAWIALCVACCLLTARMILISPQLGCAAALVVLVSGAAVRRLSAGIVAMWLVWLTAPFLRRLFALDDGLMSADPLALAPFVATFAVALVAVRRHGLGDAGARGIVLLAAVGFALGLPAGLASPEAAGFAGFAYTAGLSGFLLGYHEAHVSAGLLSRTLLVTAPALALYGVLQYFALPEWDRVWRERTNFVVALAPESDRVRIWATLNAPGTLAMVLGLSLVAFVVARPLGVGRVAGMLAVAVALSLTYVRGAWVALAVALVALLAVSRARLAPRIAVMLAIAVVGVPAVAAGTPTGSAVIGRFDTLSDLSADTSATERRQTASQVFPRAVTEPLGSGLGSAGEASRLAATQSFRYTDNGYLSLLYQVGPFGFALILAAMAGGLWRSWRLARHRDSGGVEWGIVGMLAFLLVGMATGDLFYGVTGVVFWYLLGLATRREHDMR